MPVREKACSWAARPWQGLIGHNDVLAKISPLREKIKQLADAGKIKELLILTSQGCLIRQI